LGIKCPDEKIVQRWVMAVFYYSTSGDSWFKCSVTGSDPCGSGRFLSDSSECEWAGITCNNQDCVTEIEFEKNGLVGTIPTEFGLLEDLAVLGMENGGLISSIPSEIGGLANLIFLDLDFNELTGTIPIELYSLTNMETLDLNNNLLTGNIDSIGAFGNLGFLQLQNNKFTGTVPDDMGALSLMTTFNLHKNAFTGIVPESVCALRTNTTDDNGNGIDNGNTTSGGVLESLIADCKTRSDGTAEIECSCCSSCRN